MRKGISSVAKRLRIPTREFSVSYRLFSRFIRGVSRTQVQELSNDDIALFSSMLQGVKHVQHLCEVGRAFESQVFGREEFSRAAV